MFWMYGGSVFCNLITSMPMSSLVSKRLQNTEPPYIENILEKYSNIPHIKVLALGSSYWTPPNDAILSAFSNIDRSTHRYGAILGDTNLIRKLKQNFEKKSICLDGLDFTVTCGANQAFTNVALTLCDNNQNSIVIAPYYFCHKTSLQLAGSNIYTCPFNPLDLLPDWEQLSYLIETHKPCMISLTTPNNPSGVMWNQQHFERLVALCKPYNIWIVVDETYEDFTYDSEYPHFIPCAKILNYDRIVHIYSFSKTFGMPGWRVGYILAPSSLTDSFRKIQDTIPTHAPMISQNVALHCLQLNEDSNWSKNKINSLRVVRDAMWEIVQPLGTVYTKGAFYFLVPVPKYVNEDEAIDILATQYKVLLMTGSPFGAPGHLRLSYGSLSPEDSMEAVTRLKNGFEYLIQLSNCRNQSTS